MRLVKRVLVVLALVMVPAWASAQSGASITGVVKDASGAVLPGVTVEASSPVLIEKIRTGVTDGNGVYRITELLPGTYAVTFTLTGFSTVKREDLELSGSFTSTINIDMKVGSVSETVTVSGEAPIVDVQSATRQTVVNHAVLDALPTGRNMFNVGVLIPGATLATGGLSNQDVGGARGPNTLAIGMHGSKVEDQRLTMNGVSLSTMIAGGWGGGTIPNAAGVSEIVFDTSAVSAELATGGVRINFIARDGGNRFSGTVFGAFANSAMQSSNYTDRLKGLGLQTPGGIEKNWDLNPGFGGPLKRDRLWFYLSGRRQVANGIAANTFYNLNANKPDVWTYVPDTSRQVVINRNWVDYQGRLTMQAAPKHKIGFLYNIQSNCICPINPSATISPDAANDQRFPLQRPLAVDWTSPITSKLLLEASAIHRVERWGGMHLQTNDADLDPRMISVQEFLGAYPGIRYRAAETYNNAFNTTFHWSFKASYITGGHALKFGVNDGWGSSDFTTYALNPYSYTLVGGVPTTINMQATPRTESVDVDHDFGLFAQDRWTFGRATLGLGIRYDRFINSFPEQPLGFTPLAPNRNIVFPAKANLSWHDVTPKSSFAYDIFGTGKTAFKLSLNKYLRGYGTAFSDLSSNPNPVAASINTANRPWTDGNRNFIPECNLTDFAANGECGAVSNPAFGSANPAATALANSFDPNLMTGFGKRDFNWEFSAGVQQEILPRVSMDVSFFRRWYGNFHVADNLALSPADFDHFSLKVPADPRLPGGGGYTVTDFVNVRATPATGFGFAQQNFTTLAENYGNQTEHWNGLDFNLNARMRNGFIAQGGFSTGRTSTNNCEIAAKLPEGQFGIIPGFAAPVFQNTPVSFCDQPGVFITQVKGSASYVIPRVDVQISGTYQNLPGVPMTAPGFFPAEAAAAMGRPVGGLNSIFPYFNVVQAGSMYGERLNQLDLRVAKIIRFGSGRASLNLDIYNVTNSDTITNSLNTFTPGVGGAANAWQVPLQILEARFVKIGFQIDF